LKKVGGGELSQRQSSEQNHTLEEAAKGCYRVNHPSITNYDRATGKVSGTNTPGVSAKLVKTVGGSTKKVAGKRLRVGQYSVTGHPMTSRRRDSNDCSEEATECPGRTAQKNQLRSASTVVGVVDRKQQKGVSVSTTHRSLSMIVQRER